MKQSILFKDKKIASFEAVLITLAKTWMSFWRILHVVLTPSLNFGGAGWKNLLYDRDVKLKEFSRDPSKAKLIDAAERKFSAKIVDTSG
ncbi:MAG: hypothetical protein Q7J16_03660 [Candidatus Cloacimonadales bacterium]|nr:hypothetical protein [Candidatus Cloacimonadales bacterium]